MSRRSVAAPADRIIEEMPAVPHGGERDDGAPGEAASGGEADAPIVFGQPELLEEEIAEVVDCLRSGWIGTGPRVARFEREFAAFKGTDQAVAVGSCTAALHLALLASGLEPGDEVITSALTFCGVANSIVHAGGRPVLADVDPSTLNLDPASVEERITQRTRVILPVHFAGRPCDMDSLTEIASRHRLQVIEDCAHAVEAESRSRPVGTLGDFGCFSFYATKNVTAGEGGMVLARRPETLDRIRTLALHGLTKDAWRRFRDRGYEHYDVVDVGFKYNMMDLQAAIGIHQLRRVERSWERRQRIWRRYDEAFEPMPVATPPERDPRDRHAYHLYTLRIDPERVGSSRDQFLRAMNDAGVGVGVHYRGLAEHPAYQARFGWRPEEWPVALRIGRETASLPLGPGLGDAEVERVVAAVKEFVGAG